MTDKKVVCLINLDVPTDENFKKFLSIATVHNASIALWIVLGIDDQIKAIFSGLTTEQNGKQGLSSLKSKGIKSGILCRLSIYNNYIFQKN